jgi:hypothetical protein
MTLAVRDTSTTLPDTSNAGASTHVRSRITRLSSTRALITDRTLDARAATTDTLARDVRAVVVAHARAAAVCVASRRGGICAVRVADALDARVGSGVACACGICTRRVINARDAGLGGHITRLQRTRAIRASQTPHAHTARRVAHRRRAAARARTR